MMLPLLTLLILLPLMGAVAIFLIRPHAAHTNAPWVARLMGAAHFMIALYIYSLFDPLQSGMQFEERWSWLPSVESAYHVGIDGLSLSFILLSSFLTNVLFLHGIPQKRVREYLGCFCVLLSCLVGVFVAQDVILFYFFFEAVLIPMFLLIGIWGGERRVYASFKFFLYTLVGSVLMLLALILMYEISGSTSISVLHTTLFDMSLQKWLWWAFFLAFAIKVPMWPVHTWLPDAHVEAPTSGSMILAGILLKLGGYGMLRLSLPIFPDASFHFAPYVFFLSIVAILYTSLVALVQKDIKKLIAYSSIAHMGFVTLGMFTMTALGLNGSMIQMISHGLVSAGLFFCVGVVYERFHTRVIAHYGGLASKMPRYATLFLILTMASIGVPGTSGFLGEFFVILGTFSIAPFWAILAALGVIFSAAYGLWLYRRMMYDKLNTESLSLKNMTDLKASEMCVLLLLVIPVLIFGLYPQPITALLNPYTANLMDHIHKKTHNSHSFSQPSTTSIHGAHENDA